MKKLAITLIFLLLPALLWGQNPEEYKLVVYNVENLFDADGIAVYDDYKPLDDDGNTQYTPAHLLTKIKQTSKVMSRYNGGEGPDVIMFVEIESDFTPREGFELYDGGEVLERYQATTLDHMLGEGINDEIKDLPSEMLLLKGMFDDGLKGYDVAVAYDRDDSGRPDHVQKNVIFSRLPINHAKTRSHPVDNARPILETWVSVDGHELVLFGNHWKSGASNPEIEKTRIQNAQVLKTRLDELRAKDPKVDFILGGDFNSDYNQSYRYADMEKTAVNDVLRSSGNEQKVLQGATDSVYNLWYEHPVGKRGSDVYRGYWGTLMQIMIGPGLYDSQGVQYVDGSYEVGSFPGFNVYANSGAPKRWSPFGNGGGFSDHLPISMRFTVTGQDNPRQKITLTNPGINDDQNWEPISVEYTVPDDGDVILPGQYGENSLRTSEYFDRLLKVKTTITSSYRAVINNEEYEFYAPSFNIRDAFADVAGTDQEVEFIGRLGMYRGNWQFVIESVEFVKW